jgi:hypothetical protein
MAVFLLRALAGTLVVLWAAWRGGSDAAVRALLVLIWLELLAVNTFGVRRKS